MKRRHCVSPADVSAALANVGVSKSWESVFGGTDHKDFHPGGYSSVDAINVA